MTRDWRIVTTDSENPGTRWENSDARLEICDIILENSDTRFGEF